MRFPKPLAALMLVAIVATYAWAASEALLPDGDAATTDSNWDNADGGTACSSVDCFLLVDDDPSSGDSSGIYGSTCAGTGSQVAIHARFTVADPTGGNTEWNPGQNQVVTARVAKCQTGGSNNATAQVEVWCNGDADGSPQVTGTVSGGLTDTEITITATFTDADVTCTPADIEIGILCSGAGGSPSGRRSCHMDAIRLASDVAPPASRRLWYTQ